MSRARKAREGAAALEFALIATPFFLLLFSIFQLGLVFVIDAIAENAVLKASRLVRTGQAQAQGFDAGKFKQAFCDEMSVFKSDCASRTTIDVRVVARFSDNTDPPRKENGELDLSQMNYDGGKAQDLVVVRIWYKQPMIVPSLTQAVTSAGAGQILISTATAFRNEPF
ncbi:TadE/TadG family type IV pilus assembly protein [Brevundimonas sp.]|jgi:Flp pilus assembly protein TadG|uniref:TadE/TadG family type IV pilus assembly protein n=1 Tax=Brevundimonas sp. TaxID=1871086 RepID=UPI0037BEC351